ncbi:hypothetical protein [Verrucosispora sp. NA02020]|uniref:hypothetical protein n=1 Tax=Verrucosispora sp. NA02020 TaxID=2742132 RepID=UPI003D7592A7
MARDRKTLRVRAAARLRRLGLPDTELPDTELPARAPTAAERAATRLRRLGIKPVTDQQTSQKGSRS